MYISPSQIIDETITNNSGVDSPVISTNNRPVAGTIRTVGQEDITTLEDGTFRVQGVYEIEGATYLGVGFGPTKQIAQLEAKKEAREIYETT